MLSEELYQDVNGHRENVLDSVTAAINWADAFVLASPDFHGSMSGAMKNFLDYFWEEFAGKTFGYIIASHEKGLTVADQIVHRFVNVMGGVCPIIYRLMGQMTLIPQEIQLIQY